jgi:uncharacterized protein YegL
MNQKAFNLADFTPPKAKPLPVILLLDVSGSMRGSKIDNLNAAVQDMLVTFKNTENGETEIHVAVITFGAEVKLHTPLTDAGAVTYRDLSAAGGTPLGTALAMAKAMIEDKGIIPSRAYRPMVILVSDGRPGDEWHKPLSAFVNDGRSAKCDRWAIAIGHDADESILGEFVKGTERQLFYAENASQLRDFFKFVTMTVETRTKLQDPNYFPPEKDIIQAVGVQPTTVAEKTKLPPAKPPTAGTDRHEQDEQENEERGFW